MAGFNFEADDELRGLYVQLRSLEAKAAAIREELQEKTLQKMRAEGLLDRRVETRRAPEDRRTTGDRRLVIRR